MIREFGESIIIVDQESQKLSESIRANIIYKICLTLFFNWKKNTTRLKSWYIIYENRLIYEYVQFF